MKVISPTDTTHVIKMIPRFYTVGTDLTLNIKDEAGRIDESATITDFTLLNRYLNLTFTDAQFSTLDFYENGKYQLKITDVDSGDILYRGKMIATTQTTQSYKLTNGLYTV